MQQRIGYAEGHPNSGGITARYGVYADNGDTLTVRYEGYRQGNESVGLPLNHRQRWRWDPAPVTLSRADFSLINIFATEGR